MTAGHRHDGERAASALADEYYDRCAALVAACEVVDTYDIPWLANRSRNFKRVYRDRRVPRFLKCGIDTNLSLPWHEIPEGVAMDDGLPYDTGTPNAHGDVATPLERREVERQKPDDPDIWSKYTEEMNGYIRAVDDETIERVPADMDLRVFAEDDRALLEEIIAAQSEETNTRPASARRKRFSMPQLLTPSDIVKRLKAGEKPQDIFFDATGARVAKAIGVEASLLAGDAERSVDFAISTGALDRYNSTIAVKGWKLDNFNANPVVLWAHDDSIPAIARAENTVIGERLRSRAVFADRDTHPLADTIYRLIKGKFINAASVGWIPIKWQWVDEEGRGFGVDYIEQELLEWSVVNIPANPECLVEARAVGIDTHPLMEWAERALDFGGMSVIPRAELEALRRAAGAPEIFDVRGIIPSRRQAAQQRPDAAEPYEVNAAALKTLFANGILTLDEFCDRIIDLARRASGMGAPHRAARDEDPGAGGASTPRKENAGRVLSAENEKKLQAAHDHVCAANDHCTAAMDHVRAVIEQNKKPDDDPDDDEGDDDPPADDPEQAGITPRRALAPPANPLARGAEEEERARRLRVLKLRAG
jgi:HK97 family phage prohead protease